MSDSKKRIQDALNGTDDEHLRKLYAILFDTWCWDSDNANLKELVDAIQARIDGDVDNNSSDSDITHTSGGITNEIFRFRWGTLYLGTDLELALTRFLEEQLFALFYGSGLGTGVSLDDHLKSYVDRRIDAHHQTAALQSEVIVLRSELDEIKKKLDM